jgi:hypothetical protein
MSVYSFTHKMDEQYKKACYAGAIVIVLLLVLWYFGYFVVSRPENLSNTEITNALIAKTLRQDPQNSAVLFRSMTPNQLKQFERLVPLPFDPNYYRPVVPHK